MYALQVAYPFVLERTYVKEITKLVAEIYKDIIEYFTRIKSSYNLLIRKDEFNDDFNSFVELCKFQISIRIREFIPRITKIILEVNKFNDKAVTSSLRHIPRSVMQITTTKEIRTAMELIVSDNVRLIKSVNENLLGQVQEVIYSGVRRGLKISALSEELQNKFTLSKKRATLIARDQIQKAHSDLTRLRHEELGIKEYKWLTGRDERVRPSHKVLEGKICNYDNVSVYKDEEADKKWLQKSEIGGALYHPGQEIQCRCTPIAIIKI